MPCFLSFLRSFCVSLLFLHVDDGSHPSPSLRVHQRGLLLVCTSLLLNFQELWESVVKRLKLKISTGWRIDSTAMGEFLAQGNLQTVHIRAFLPQIFFLCSFLRLKKTISYWPRLEAFTSTPLSLPYLDWISITSLHKNVGQWGQRCWEHPNST